MPKEDLQDEVKSTKSKSMRVSKDDYDFLMNQLKDLSKEVKDLRGGVVELERTKEHTCNLRMWDGKLVTSFTDAWNVFDPLTRETKVYIGLHFRGVDEASDIELVDFYRNSKYIECKIKERRLLDEGIKDYGTVEVKRTKGNKTVGTGVRVRQNVATPIYELLLQLPSGEELVVEEKYVN